MRRSVTVGLSEALSQKLERHSKGRKSSRSDVVREALDEYFARREFRDLHDRIARDMEVRGIRTDEDVFRELT